jgi:hypothetical protein
MIQYVLVGKEIDDVKMAYAQCLRVIGQSIEIARLGSFTLESDGENYILTSDSLTDTGEWILRHALSPLEMSKAEENISKATAGRSARFTPLDISRLDDQARKQRRFNSSPGTQANRRLSQLLRTVGDHLDRTETNAFKISWTSGSIVVDFRSLTRGDDCRTFTEKKLEQLGSHSRFRRSSATRRDPGFLRPRK